MFRAGALDQNAVAGPTEVTLKLVELLDRATRKRSPWREALNVFCRTWLAYDSSDPRLRAGSEFLFDRTLHHQAATRI